MTNPPLPDDELASALVDGLGDDQERARLASDPALAARVEQLRAVRRAVATSTATGAPPPAEARERAIAAALAAAPQQLPAHDHPPTSDRPPPPIDLDAQRVRRKAWLPAAAAAAVVAVLGLGAFAALRDGADGDRDVTAAADSAATTLAGAGDLQRESTFDAAGTTAATGGATTTATTRSGQDGSGAGSATTTATAPAAGGAPAPSAVGDGLPDLGPIDETDALRAALAALPAAAGEAGTEATSCATDPTGRLVARLTWVGQPALVVVVDGPPSRAVVVTAVDCHPLAEVPLP